MSDVLPVPIIVSADGSVRYQCTGLDILTLARSARKESRHDVVELGWCYAQRLVMLHKRGNRITLAALITAHSQPINPIWFPTGSKCRPGGEYHGTPSCANAASRPGNASIAWDAIEASVRNDVLAFARATVPNPVKRATDFAEEHLVDRKIAGSNPLGFRMVRRGVSGQTNSFVSEPDSRAWPSDDYVRVQFEGRTAGSNDGAGPTLKTLTGAVALLVVAAAWMFARGNA